MKVVVVGAGIIGLSAAYHLRVRGHDVEVLEREQELGEGCSYGNGGVLVPSHYLPLAAPGMISTGLKYMRSSSSPFGMRMPPSLSVLSWVGKFAMAATAKRATEASKLIFELNSRGLDEYDSLLSGIGSSVSPERNGLLVVCGSSQTLEHERSAMGAAKDLGLTLRELSREELQFEAGTEIRAAGAIKIFDDAHLHPPTVMADLIGWLERNSVHVRTGISVDGFSREGSKIQTVSHSAGETPCDAVVLAAGAWAGTLAQRLGVKLPMVAGQGYGLTVKAPSAPMNVPMILVEPRVAVTPMPDGIRFVGTLELAPPAIKVNEARVEGMRRAISERLPQLGESAKQAKLWTGLRPCTPDGLPYVGKPKALDNLIVAAGHAMMGMSLGPITGRLIGEIVDGQPTSLPLQLMDPNRYA